MTPEQRFAVAAVANLLMGTAPEVSTLTEYLNQILPPPTTDLESIRAALEALPTRLAGLLLPLVILAANAVAGLAESDDPQARAAMLSALASRLFEEGGDAPAH